MPLGSPEYDELGGKTTGLLLGLLSSIFHSGCYFVLNSGFYVLRALIELKKKGVFTAALIKKRSHCPTLVPGDHTIDYFKDKVAGVFDAISGVLDGIKYDIWCIKEPEYCMSIMATEVHLVQQKEKK